MKPDLQSPKRFSICDLLESSRRHRRFSLIRSHHDNDDTETTQEDPTPSKQPLIKLNTSSRMLDPIKQFSSVVGKPQKRKQSWLEH